MVVNVTLLVFSVWFSEYDSVDDVLVVVLDVDLIC